MTARLRALVALLMALAMLAAACGGSDEASSDSSDEGSSESTELEEVGLLLPFPVGIPFAPLVVGQENGYFADEGIEVKPDVADGSGYVSQQLVAGNIEFAVMGAADIVVASSKRDDVKVLVCNQVKNVYRIVAVADSGITDLDGLAGNTLGITEPGGGENQFVKAALAAAGITDDVEVLPIGAAGPQTLAAIQDGTVQAYSSSFPDIASLTASGVEFVEITPAKYSNLPGTCIVSTQEVLDTEDGLRRATALASGWVEGQYYALGNPEEAFSTICGAYPSACENEVAAQALFDEALNVIRPEDGERPGDVSAESWATMVEVLTESGAVEAGTDMTGVVEGEQLTELRDAAYAGH